MDLENRKRLLRKEINGLLVKFHKGESLGLTTTAIMELIQLIQSRDASKICYILYGLKLKRIEDTPNNDRDAIYKEAFNEAADQNNFAVRLAIDSFEALNDEEKQ